MSNILNILNSVAAPAATDKPVAPAQRPATQGTQTPFDQVLQDASNKTGSAPTNPQNPNPVTGNNAQAQAANQVDPSKQAPALTKTTPPNQAQAAADVKAADPNPTTTAVSVQEVQVVQESVSLSIQAANVAQGLEKLSQLLQTLAQLPPEQGANLLVSLTNGQLPKAQALAFVKAFQALWNQLGPIGQQVLKTPEFKLGLLDQMQNGLPSQSPAPALPASPLAQLMPALTAGTTPTVDSNPSDYSGISLTGLSSSMTQLDLLTVSSLTQQLSTALAAYSQTGLPVLDLGQAAGSSTPAALPADWTVRLADPSQGSDQAGKALRNLVDLLTESKAGRVLLTQTLTQELRLNISGPSFPPVAPQAPTTTLLTAPPAAQLTALTLSKDQAPLPTVTASVPAVTPPAVSSAQTALDFFKQVLSELQQALLQEPPTQVSAPQVQVDGTATDVQTALPEGVAQVVTPQATTPAAPSTTLTPAAAQTIQTVLDFFRVEAKGSTSQQTTSTAPLVTEALAPVPFVPVSVPMEKLQALSTAQPPVTQVQGLADKPPVPSDSSLVGKSLADMTLPETLSQPQVLPGNQVVSSQQASVGPQTGDGSIKVPILPTGTLVPVTSHEGSDAVKSLGMEFSGLNATALNATAVVTDHLDPNAVLKQVAQQVEIQVAQTHTVTRLSFQLIPESLGKVTIQVALMDQSVTARILVANPEVRDVLSNHMIELKTAMNQAGLQIDQMQVHVQGGSTNLLGQYFQYQQEGFTYQSNSPINTPIYRETDSNSEPLTDQLGGYWNSVNLLV